MIIYLANESWLNLKAMKLLNFKNEGEWKAISAINTCLSQLGRLLL